MEPRDVYLIRHAIAAERGPEWPDDRQRPLTEVGVARFTEAVKGLAWLGVGIDEVFTSPLVRARQTADVLVKGLAKTAVVKTLDAMAPGHTSAEAVNQLARAARRRRVALVGHEPGLGELAAHLLGAPRAIPFKKGAVCLLSVPTLTGSRPAELIWLLPPKVLRRLAG